MILFIYLPGNWGGGEVYIYIKTAKFYVENGFGSGWLVVFSRGLWHKAILLVICRQSVIDFITDVVRVSNIAHKHLVWHTRVVHTAPPSGHDKGR